MQLEAASSKLETVLAHTVCSGWEIRSLQERLNLKTNAKKRKVQVNAQYVSSAEATQILEEYDCEEAEKRRREEEAQAVKKAKDDQRKQQHEAGSITFAGSLNSKTKDDLLDISYVSGLYCLVLTDYFQRIVMRNGEWRGSWDRGFEGLTKG